jgi:uncharacterized integral membrane protein
MWTATAIIALLLLVLVIFIAQNGQRAHIHFFGATWSMSLAVGLLFAAVLGALIVLVAGALRIGQLRLAARRHLRGGSHADPAGAGSQQQEPDSAEPRR